MSTFFSVALVDSDPQVINDVTCSLRLVNVPLASATSVDDAKRLLAEVKPNLILVRPTIQGDKQAGARVIEYISLQDELKAIPLVALVTHNERHHIERVRSMCTGELLLPVEFPTFTQQVMSFIAGGKTGGRKEAKPAQVALASENGESRAAQPAAVSSAATPTSDARLVSAYAIQLAVLEQLKSNESFQRASLGEVPKIVAEVTNQVCLSFSSPVAKALR